MSQAAANQDFPCGDDSLAQVVELVEDGRRIDREGARILWENASFLELGRLGNIVRQRVNPGDVVTYLVDRNINYTISGN